MSAITTNAAPVIATAPREIKELSWDDVEEVDPVGLEVAHRLISLVEKSQGGEPAVLLVSPKLRPWLARFVRPRWPALNVLAYNEVPENRRIRVVAALGARVPLRYSPEPGAEDAPLRASPNI